ncbi:transcription intermediary factor 1-beta-like [Pecten maximus]|uniref:transcription intermediary factor 1-beta-like n=1 Tax=Pecten maximus TaxID=6579 RepID=UPI001458B1D3|nr:transcription intermediary factor 1-beta-like [Pecten maximus]
MPGLSSYSQPNLFKLITKSNYKAHDAVQDVISLQKLVRESKLEISDESYANATFSVDSAKESHGYAKRVRVNLPSLKGLVGRKILSGAMARKAAGSGLNYSCLKLAYTRNGVDGIRNVFGEKCGMKGSRVWRVLNLCVVPRSLVTYTCSLCDSVDNVNWYCNDCQVALCDRCKEVHTRGKKTRNDDVVSIGKASRQEDKPVPEVCKLHPSKRCDLHCADCNEMLCSICVSKTHKHHNWKHLEETLPAVKEQIKEHMGAISGKIELFKNEISKLHRANKASIDNIDTTRKHVNAQRSELIAEVNSVADAVLDELSALEKEESVAHKTDCQQYEEKVQELTLLHGKAEATKTNRSIISLLK